jgi:uncharacterized protein (DUF1800 family)
VREQARALTGWTNDWDDDLGAINFRFDPDLHDGGSKRILGQTGAFDWRDSCRLCVEHPAHPGYMVRKLWSYFVPTDPPKKTLTALKKLYRKRNYAIRPVVEAILVHPAFYEGPRMVKPPIVQIAGMLRARKSGITTDDWSWIAEDAGQRLFRPPNVAGWDETRWLDTARLSGRWEAAAQSTDLAMIPDDDHYDAKETPKEAVTRALRFWGTPTLSSKTHSELLRFANRVEAIAKEEWQQSSYRAVRQNALRMLIASSPDFQTA